MKYLELAVWFNSDTDPDFKAAHGYTRRTEDDRAVFRAGPLVIAWEVTEA